MNDKRVYEIPTSVMEKADGSSVTVKDAKARRMLDRKPEINDTTPSATSVYSSQKVEQKLAAAVADFVSFSEDQTSRTDAEKAQARANIGAVRPWVKLWENASPSSDFAAQDVSVNLSDYTEIMIYWRQVTSDTYYFTQTHLIVASTNSYLFNNSAGRNIRRGFTFASDLLKITFDGGQRYQSYGTATASNSYAIPVKIYAR